METFLTFSVSPKSSWPRQPLERNGTFPGNLQSRQANDVSYAFYSDKSSGSHTVHPNQYKKSLNDSGLKSNEYQKDASSSRFNQRTINPANPLPNAPFNNSTVVEIENIDPTCRPSNTSMTSATRPTRGFRTLDLEKQNMLRLYIPEEGQDLNSRKGKGFLGYIKGLI
jgi:hypothetical protein